jgi:hypothetical protein
MATPGIRSRAPWLDQLQDVLHSDGSADAHSDHESVACASAERRLSLELVQNYRDGSGMVAYLRRSAAVDGWGLDGNEKQQAAQFVHRRRRDRFQFW